MHVHFQMAFLTINFIVIHNKRQLYNFKNRYFLSGQDDKYMMFEIKRMSPAREDLSKMSVHKSQHPGGRVASVGHAVFPETCCQSNTK